MYLKRKGNWAEDDHALHRFSYSMAASEGHEEDSSIPLLSPYRLGPFHLSHRYLHTCIYVPTFKHYIHKYVYTYITPIYTCILTKHEYIYKYILSYVDMYIHIHKYKYVNAYMLHTYYNKRYVLTDNPFILHNIQIYL